mgnify:FL=1
MSNHNPMNIATDFAKHGGTARKVVALTDKGPLNGFKKFLSRGSMIDMAVGVVMALPLPLWSIPSSTISSVH